MRQAFREHDRLIVSGRIGELDDPHLAAGARAPLGARHYRTRDAAGARSRAHSAGKLGPRLDPHALESSSIVVQRMAGEEESDRSKLLLQPLRWKPRLDVAERDRRACGGAAKQFGLADGDVIVGALRGSKYGIDGGEHAGAVGFERIEGARRGEAFQHALVHRVRLDPGGKIGQVGKWPLAARLDDRLDRLTADALERGERVMDRRAFHLKIDAGTVHRWRLDFHT